MIKSKYCPLGHELILTLEGKLFDSPLKLLFLPGVAVYARFTMVFSVKKDEKCSSFSASSNSFRLSKLF
jgi:hypothetical protein